MNTHNRIVIYGLREANDSACIYVGRTVNPTARINSHFNTGERKGRKLEMFYLASAITEEEAAEKEYKWIARLKSEGEPLENKRLYESPPRRKPKAILKIAATGQTFPSQAALGRFLGYATGSSVASSRNGQRRFYMPHPNNWREQIEIIDLEVKE